jgi:hypothetical protein
VRDLFLSFRHAHFAHVAPVHPRLSFDAAINRLEKAKKKERKDAEEEHETARLR